MSNCTGNYVKWAADVFGECISTRTEKWGFGIGLLSTLIWMYAQLPQIYLNYKNKSVEGLSFIFLCFLLTGDLCNVTGLIITGGLVTQFITGIFFICVDGFCVSQYIYYKWLRPKCKPQLYDDAVSLATEDDQSRGLLPILGTVAAASATIIDPYKPPYLIGTIIGWISAAIYMSSRTPQIAHNCRRKRTDGLSFQFFISAFLGNSTYAISIFLKDSRWGYIWQQLPWLAGSAGLLFFDFAILVQFFVYRKNTKPHEAGEYLEIGHKE